MTEADGNPHHKLDVHEAPKPAITVYGNLSIGWTSGTKIPRGMPVLAKHMKIALSHSARPLDSEGCASVEQGRLDKKRCHPLRKKDPQAFFFAKPGESIAPGRQDTTCCFSDIRKFLCDRVRHSIWKRLRLIV